MSNKLALHTAQQSPTVLTRLSSSPAVVRDGAEGLTRPANAYKTSTCVLKAFQFEVILNWNVSKFRCAPTVRAINHAASHNRGKRLAWCFAISSARRAVGGGDAPRRMRR